MAFTFANSEAFCGFHKKAFPVICNKWGMHTSIILTHSNDSNKFRAKLFWNLLQLFTILNAKLFKAPFQLSGEEWCCTIGCNCKDINSDRPGPHSGHFYYSSWIIGDHIPLLIFVVDLLFIVLPQPHCSTAAVIWSPSAVKSLDVTRKCVYGMKIFKNIQLEHLRRYSTCNIWIWALLVELVIQLQ